MGFLENMGAAANLNRLHPRTQHDQLSVRMTARALSDVKILKQGGSHPKLYNRDLSVDPTRLGHEVALTIVKVGRNLQKNYKPGQRLAVQPDIYQQGKSTAYGYTIPGGLIQYHLIGSEVLETDAGACLLPVEEEMGYAESSLLEPWGCVMAAYTQRRRLSPKKEGTMWIIGQPDDSTSYTFSAGLDAPAAFILTDVPDSVKKLVSATRAKIVERNGLTPANYESLGGEFTNGAGFDDIVILNPTSASAVSQIAVDCRNAHATSSARNRSMDWSRLTSEGCITITSRLSGRTAQISLHPMVRYATVVNCAQAARQSSSAQVARWDRCTSSARLNSQMDPSW
jgi:threonine dehydrogenase-like Zn-dependent dehydrogenase